MKVSFIVPVFNCGALLKEALASIADNACAGVQYEILLIDDLSTDPDTVALLARLGKSDGITVIRHTANQGPARARNTGIRAATGKWIAFLDADDMLAPGTMALRLAAISQIPKMDWLAGDMLEMWKPGELIHHKTYSVDGRDGLEVLPGVFELKRPTKKLVGWPNLPVIGSMMIKKELIHEIGLFNEDLIYGEDVHFCLLATYYADLYWLTTPCLYLRRYHESMTKDRMRMARESPRYTGLLLRDTRLRIVTKELRWQHAAALRHLCRMSLVHHDRLQAIRAALLSIVCIPHDLRGFRLLMKSLFRRTGGELSDI